MLVEMINEYLVMTNNVFGLTALVGVLFGS